MEDPLQHPVPDKVGVASDLEGKEREHVTGAQGLASSADGVVAVSVDGSGVGTAARCVLRACRHPCGWVSITVAVAIIFAAVVQPIGCHSDSKCQRIAKDEAPLIYNQCAAFALGAFLVHEVASLCLTWKLAQQAIDVIHNIRDFMIPGVFLCVTFAILVIENVAHMNSTKWHAHVARGATYLDSEPVYTVFYIEWLINVPILLILAGRYALSRPLDEVARPLVVTNVYIIFAWAGYFIQDTAARVIVVAIAFILYFFASADMFFWVRKFYDGSSAAELGYLRPFLTISLIVIFGLYGIVYLCRLCGVVSGSSEWLFFLVMNASTKLLASIAFAGIRSAEYHSLLLEMVANTNTVFQRSLTAAEIRDKFLLSED
eukprot:TRINITY_DN6229_c0_g1_i3.p1 TRINITY_DN6229_c0_g1~~TRINITY_DN6229_c0_g1_i3.p1  ORF type:complete len:374 (-),score=42.43 TRINITY_DN6229_c0_g1_i3:111-1232(-)